MELGDVGLALMVVYVRSYVVFPYKVEYLHEQARKNHKLSPVKTLGIVGVTC